MDSVEGKKFPDCRKCRDSQNESNERYHRELWGCDRDASRPVFTIACACGGRRRRCRKCKGTGRQPFKRCPSSMLRKGDERQAMSVLTAFEFYQEYAGRHQLPAAGAIADQSPWFMEFCGVVDSERAFWDRERDEMARKAAEASRAG